MYSATNRRSRSLKPAAQAGVLSVMGSGFVIAGRIAGRISRMESRRYKARHCHSAAHDVPPQRCALIFDCCRHAPMRISPYVFTVPRRHFISVPVPKM